MMSLRAAVVALCCLFMPLISRAGGPDSAVHLSYSLPADAQISLLFTDAKGHVVRELLHAAPRKRGLNTEAWDGLDDEGRPAAAGVYTWKLLATQGLKAEYLMTIGTNPTPDYEPWPGNHGGASAVAADATGIYVAGGAARALRC